jgi:hypothetical protein
MEDEATRVDDPARQMILALWRQGGAQTLIRAIDDAYSKLERVAGTLKALGGPERYPEAVQALREVWEALGGLRAEADKIHDEVQQVAGPSPTVCSQGATSDSPGETPS